MEPEYIEVEWPESQYFMGYDGVTYNPKTDIWYVPKEVYDSVCLQFQNDEYTYGHNVSNEEIL